MEPHLPCSDHSLQTGEPMLGTAVADVKAWLLIEHRERWGADLSETQLDPAVRLVLRRCLERHVTDRLQHMGDARILLGETLAGAGGGEKPPARRPRILVIGLAAVLLVSLAFNLFNIHLPGRFFCKGA